MLLNKYYVIVHVLKITSLIQVSRAGSTHSGGFVNAGGWGTRKIARQFHAASTRRDKNTRHAWKCCRSDALTLLRCILPHVKMGRPTFSFLSGPSLHHSSFSFPVNTLKFAYHRSPTALPVIVQHLGLSWLTDKNAFIP